MRLSTPLCPPPPIFLFFTAPAPTEIYTLSLHDALPIFTGFMLQALQHETCNKCYSNTFSLIFPVFLFLRIDRKSTRLNSSHRCISYAVFCLKKKKRHKKRLTCDV